MNRALPGLTNDDAVRMMTALAGAEARAKKDRAEKTMKAANDVYDRLHEEINARVLPEFLHDFMVLFFAYLRDKQGFGEKRLAKAAKEIEDYFGGIFDAQIPTEMISKNIKEECGFDIEKSFRHIFEAWGGKGWNSSEKDESNEEDDSNG